MLHRAPANRLSVIERIGTIWCEHALAARRLARNTGFTIVVVLTLGLAIGGNAAIYSVMNGVLFKPLPYPDPEQLVRIFAPHPRFDDVPLTPSDLHAFRQHEQVFQGMAATPVRGTSSAAPPDRRTSKVCSCRRVISSCSAPVPRSA